MYIYIYTTYIYIYTTYIYIYIRIYIYIYIYVYYIIQCIYIQCMCIYIYIYLSLPFSLSLHRHLRKFNICWRWAGGPAYKQLRGGQVLPWCVLHWWLRCHWCIPLAPSGQAVRKAVQFPAQWPYNSCDIICIKLQHTYNIIYIYI